MNELYIKVKLETPLIITGEKLGETFKCLDYIPGSTLRGVIAGMMMRNGTKPDKKDFKDIFINSNSKVQAGTALGEMGSTGVATGEHLHYEIQIKDSSVWKLVNPLSYIK